MAFQFRTSNNSDYQTRIGISFKAFLPFLLLAMHVHGILCEADLQHEYKTMTEAGILHVFG
jgi:hypothetical protein